MAYIYVCLVFSTFQLVGVRKNVGELILEKLKRTPPPSKKKKTTTTNKIKVTIINPVNCPRTGGSTRN